MLPLNINKIFVVITIFIGIASGSNQNHVRESVLSKYGHNLSNFKETLDYVNQLSGSEKITGLQALVETMKENDDLYTNEMVQVALNVKEFTFWRLLLLLWNQEKVRSKHKIMSFNTFFITILTIHFALISGTVGKQQPCEVETGQTNIILDIEESRGSYVGQRTTPMELPIYGDPYTEIALELIFPKGNPIFLLNGKQLQLLQPLDRDEENLSHIVFQIACTIRSTRRKRNIPIIVRVSDINDNPPVFINTPYETTVPESTPVGTTIFRNILAQDQDAGVNGLVEYFLVEGPQNISVPDTLTAADGYGIFAISYPHQGQVTVVKTLDYERIQRYYLTVVASDRARNSSERLSATTTLTINIQDSDDLDPSFIYRGCVLLDGACINPEYTASVPAGTLQGVLTVQPEKIQAVDLDTISSPIKYSFLSGNPQNYDKYFEIDEQTGVLKQIKLVDSSVTARKFDIILKAEEVSELKRFTTAKLTINVKPVDQFPPVISATSIEGFVDENSPVGTKILDSDGKPIKLTTTDSDITEGEDKPIYGYELTTPSFSVSKDGYLLVNEEGLDRDAPSPGKFRFQIVSREMNGNAASAPLSVTVTLNDVNDNPPKLPMIEPVSIPAGDGKRLVTKVTATDNDIGENAEISYSLYHVSNNGANKFMINAKTGEIETRGRLMAGEHYSLTVQASDIGGLNSQAIVEITVNPGPNTKPPIFSKSIYEVQVSEGAELNSTVVVVKAEDPEGDPITYAIMSGNDLRQFSVGSESGIISVIRKLDREVLTRYQLIIKAEDLGGLSSSSTVNIKVSDINDKNPEFDEDTLPYTFSVEEGKRNVTVGTVHATDADEGVNAEITYSLPDDIPFVINSKSGEIRTKTSLDYETKKEYKFVVTATDGAPDMRLGTASVTVRVVDVEDELPRFADQKLEVKVPENVPDMLIGTVQAYDPDTVQSITYVMKDGPSDLFKIDSKTGQIKTIRGLDYETSKNHELIIGTKENTGTDAGDVIKVIIEVDDRNDIPPVFVSIPEPVTVSDDQQIGAIVGSMPAIDGDGTSPGNVVRYEMVGRGKALKYFIVDTDTGIIRLRDDLRKDEDTEYQVDIRAYDLGEPQLSSVATLAVFVRHVLTDPNGDDSIESRKGDEPTIDPENLGLAFSDTLYTTSIPESTGANATLKLIQVINSKKANKNKNGFKCEISDGNEEHIFKVTVEDHACAIKLIKPLDYENHTSHELSIKLVSSKFFINPQKSVAKVKMIVQDVNDNAPIFQFLKHMQVKSHPETYYGIVSLTADIDTPVMQVKATDRDSGIFGTIKYRLLDEEHNFISNDDLPSSYFQISEDTGMIKTQKTLHTVTETPLKFYVEARDSNDDKNGKIHRTKARIVVNVISDMNRMTLVFSDATPKDVRKHGIALEELLREKTEGLLMGIEKFSTRKSLNENGTVIEQPGSTDVWFYAVDPETEKIMERNSSEVKDRLLVPEIQSQINFAASGIARATAQGIYAPIEAKQHTQHIKTAVVIDNEVFPYTLIAIAVIILILGTVGIIYICVSWSKYKNFKQRMRQYSAPASPVRYDPVIINSQNGESPTSLKEYETQVLAMAVPNDEGEDLHIDFSAKNHAFSLDNVSYITHKESGNHSPANSDATTAIVGTLRRNNNNNNINLNLSNNINNSNNNNQMNNRQNSINKTLELNRNHHINPLGSGQQGSSLTLGRIRSERNNYINAYGDTLNRNNLTMAQNNTFNTLGRSSNIYNNQNVNEYQSNTLGRNSRYSDMPITNPLFQGRRQNGHLSSTNDNVTFGKRDYAEIGYPYLNDIDRSDNETTTEL
uniref:CSON004492 protein n=1 Tax=Culicoides sonorensis TaxID=179676 RepID=A0A336LX47_CULSO